MKGNFMSEKKKKDLRLIEIGKLIRSKRVALGSEYKNREFFIENRGADLFDNDCWISSRYLASLELGNNKLSIDLLIKLAYALEVDPVELFSDILQIYQSY